MRVTRKPGRQVRGSPSTSKSKEDLPIILSLFDFLLSLSLSKEARECLTGDILEEYKEISSKYHRVKVEIWIYNQVLTSFGLLIYRPLMLGVSAKLKFLRERIHSQELASLILIFLLLGTIFNFVSRRDMATLIIGIKSIGSLREKGLPNASFSAQDLSKSLVTPEGQQMKPTAGEFWKGSSEDTPLPEGTVAQTFPPQITPVGEPSIDIPGTFKDLPAAEGLLPPSLPERTVAQTFPPQITPVGEPSIDIPGTFKDMSAANDGVTAKRLVLETASTSSQSEDVTRFTIDESKGVTVRPSVKGDMNRPDGNTLLAVNKGGNPSVVEATDTEFEDFHATAYCLQGRTASGEHVKQGMITADPRVLPIGTVVHIRAGSYTGTYTVKDTGGQIKGRHVDVYVPTYRDAKAFGRRPVKIKVISQPNHKAALTGRNSVLADTQ